MTGKNARPANFERLRYTQGQMLRSRDFRDQAIYDAQLRWWHNRALHSAGFGVAHGLAVVLSDDLTAVIVECGLAYDAFGRELVLFECWQKALPRDKAPMLLLIRYRDAPPAAGTCQPDTPESLVELVWMPERKVRPQDGVPLALLTYPNDTPVVGAAVRRARAMARPRIGHGATIAGGTPWEPWQFTNAQMELASVLGIQVRVDTTAAGFTEVPCYFAWLQWPKIAPNRAHVQAIITLGLQYLEEPSINGFVFRAVLLPSGIRLKGSVDSADVLSFAQSQQLSICWLGVQHDGDAPEANEKRTCNGNTR